MWCFTSNLIPTTCFPENVQRDLLYINLACLSVRLYPINVKTAEPIGPKFCVGPNMTLGRFLDDQKIKN